MYQNGDCTFFFPGWQKPKRCSVMDLERGIAAIPHSFKECRTGMKLVHGSHRDCKTWKNGKSGNFARLEKSGNFTQNTGKIRKNYTGKLKKMQEKSGKFVSLKKWEPCCAAQCPSENLNSAFLLLVTLKRWLPLCFKSPHFLKRGARSIAVIFTFDVILL